LVTPPASKEHHHAGTLRLIQSSQESAEESSSHKLRKQLGLRDLVPMQILMVVGLTWSGLAARQGSTHVAFWLLGVLLLFLPVAAVVHYCVKIWPLEGGVYQWTKHAIGPFAGFLSAWNFAIWALLVVSALGIVSATSLSYALGPSAAWMETSPALIMSLNIGLFALILLVNIPGLGVGRWVAHFGTAVTVLVTALLMVLLIYHPHASAAHPHVSPQRPFSLALPAMTLMSLNLFGKLTFNALTGLEQVAVFAGETRNAARTILRSAWIAAPIIIVIYMSMAGAMLSYTPADRIDLTGPIPQVLAAAFDTGGASPGSGIDIGLLLGRGAILLLAVATAAQFAIIVAETARLPMVAAWDHLLPAWFTRLHPRYRTPTRSLAVIVILAVLLCALATAGTGNQEAFQVLVTCGNVSYAINYLLMFSVPLVAGARFGVRAGPILRLACVAGMLVTLLSIVFSLIPVVDVRSSGLYALKIGLTALALNLLGALLYWRGSRIKRREHRLET
jgi:amino acid transporter